MPINNINMGTVQLAVGRYVGVGGLVGLSLGVVNGSRHGMLLPKDGLTTCHAIGTPYLGWGLAYPGLIEAPKS